MGQRYLIVGPAWVGDMVMAQSLYMLIREREPDAAIDVLAPSWSLPLLQRMPEVRRAIEVPVGHGQFGLSVRWRIGRALRAERYDRAIVLPRSLKAALIPYLAGARRRTGYLGELRYGLLNDIRPLDKTALPRVIDRYHFLALDGEPLPAQSPQPRLTVDSENQQRVLQQLGLHAHREIVALMPGAEYGPAKQWPLHYYGELAARLVAQGFQVWVFGSHKDRAAAEAIMNIAGAGVSNLCGRTQLVDVVDLLALATVAVSNDSGLMHVAAAVGTPLVAIYGSSTPNYTPPLTARAEVIWQALECSPCFKRQCPLGHTDCLNGISVTTVEQHLQRLLAAGGEQ